MSERRGERLSSGEEGGAGVLPRAEHRHVAAERRGTILPIGPDKGVCPTGEKRNCRQDLIAGVLPSAIGTDERCMYQRRDVLSCLSPIGPDAQNLITGVCPRGKEGGGNV